MYKRKGGRTEKGTEVNVALLLYTWFIKKKKLLHHRGVMRGNPLLTRSLPEASDDTYWLLVTKDEVGVHILPESVTIDSEGVASASGIIRHMHSSSLTTSDIEGLASVSSRQHLRANDTNFSTHSEG